jgi:hypothetical protein
MLSVRVNLPKSISRLSRLVDPITKSCRTVVEVSSPITAAKYSCHPAFEAAAVPQNGVPKKTIPAVDSRR